MRLRKCAKQAEQHTAYSGCMHSQVSSMRSHGLRWSSPLLSLTKELGPLRVAHQTLWEQLSTIASESITSKPGICVAHHSVAHSATSPRHPQPIVCSLRQRARSLQASSVPTLSCSLQASIEHLLHSLALCITPSAPTRITAACTQYSLLSSQPPPRSASHASYTRPYAPSTRGLRHAVLASRPAQPHGLQAAARALVATKAAKPSEAAPVAASESESESAARRRLRLLAAASRRASRPVMVRQSPAAVDTVRHRAAGSCNILSRCSILRSSQSLLNLKKNR